MTARRSPGHPRGARQAQRGVHRGSPPVPRSPARGEAGPAGSSSWQPAGPPVTRPGVAGPTGSFIVAARRSPDHSHRVGPAQRGVHRGSPPVPGSPGRATPARRATSSWQPNIAKHRGSAQDPLHDFLESLGKLERFGSEEALPTHEYRFRSVPGRAAELIAHHHERSAEVLAVVARLETPTAWAIAAELTWSRGWAELHGLLRRFALSETSAPLPGHPRGVRPTRGYSPAAARRPGVATGPPRAPRALAVPVRKNQFRCWPAGPRRMWSARTGRRPGPARGARSRGPVQPRHGRCGRAGRPRPSLRPSRRTPRRRRSGP